MGVTSPTASADPTPSRDALLWVSRVNGSTKDQASEPQTRLIPVQAPEPKPAVELWHLERHYSLIKGQEPAPGPPSLAGEFTWRGLATPTPWNPVGVVTGCHRGGPLSRCCHRAGKMDIRGKPRSLLLTTKKAPSRAHGSFG